MKLRKLMEKDAPFMLEWMHDPEVTADLRKDFSSFTIDHCLKFIRTSESSKNTVHRAIVNDEDEYLGTVTVRDIDETIGCGEFAITVRKCAMGTGAAIYGMRKIIYYALNDLGLKTVYWCVSADNARAVRFYRKNGFSEIQKDSVPAYLTNEYSEEKNLLWFFCE